MSCSLAVLVTCDAAPLLCSSPLQATTWTSLASAKLPLVSHHILGKSFTFSMCRQNEQFRQSIVFSIERQFNFDFFSRVCHSRDNAVYLLWRTFHSELNVVEMTRLQMDQMIRFKRGSNFPRDNSQTYKS